jgi:hypothetical protein
LVAEIWAYREPAQVRRPLQCRLAKLPPPIPAIRGQAQGRLCNRYRRRSARGKHALRASWPWPENLEACLWAMAQAVPVTRQAPRRRALAPTSQQGANVHLTFRTPLEAIDVFSPSIFSTHSHTQQWSVVVT